MIRYDSTSLSEQVRNVSCIPSALFTNLTDKTSGQDIKNRTSRQDTKIKIHTFIITMTTTFKANQRAFDQGLGA